MSLPIVSDATIMSTLASAPEMALDADGNVDENNNLFMQVARENPGAVEFLAKFIKRNSDEMERDDHKELIHVFFVGGLLMYYLLRRQAEADDFERDFTITPDHP